MTDNNLQQCICNWEVGMGADVRCPIHGMGQQVINHYEACEPEGSYMTERLNKHWRPLVSSRKKCVTVYLSI